MKNSISSPIPYGKQHITPEDIAAVVEALQADLLTQGPRIAQFEADFAHYIDVPYAVAVANGTAALHLCALALGCEGKKVLVTSLTFAASANCIRYAGGEPDFVDIDPETLLMDIHRTREKLAAAPHGTYAGIIVVDFAGNPVNLQVFRALADDFGVWLLEDACHAPGGYFVDDKGLQQRCGNGEYADLAIFSFHPVKHIAAGEGGMVTTRNAALAEKIALLRNHGLVRDPQKWQLSADDIAQGGWYYEMQELGFNYRLTDIQAALATSQLRRADENLYLRRKFAARYDSVFANTPIQAAPFAEGNAYHLYVVQVNNRAACYAHLRSQQIFPQIHYIPVHLLPYYRQRGWQRGDCPHAEAYYDRCLSLPLYPTLQDDEQIFVVEQLMAIAE